MFQYELANLLGVSAADVSKLKKRGMPVDSLERAKKWRKRHLEQGRIKGVRFDAKQQAKNFDEKKEVNKNISVASCVNDGIYVIEFLANSTNKAMLNGNNTVADVLILQLRELLQQFHDVKNFKLPLRVWISLVDYVLSDDALVRKSSVMDSLITPGEFGGLVNDTWDENTCLDHARDLNGHSNTGFIDSIYEFEDN